MDENMKMNGEVEKKDNSWILGYVMLGAAAFIGYKVGYSRCDRQINKGLSLTFKADPELEGRMWDAIKKVAMTK